MSANGTVTAERKLRNMTKQERYDWRPIERMGRYALLNKTVLHVDHSYQRTSISKSRIAEIARNWSWPAFGTLGVYQRSDSSHWIFDGQHRHGASLKRDDIIELPCMVYSSTDAEAYLRQEAKAFVEANTARKAMRRLEKHRAAIVARDKTALAIEDLVESCGYKITSGASANGFAGVEAIERAMKSDARACEEAFMFCAVLARGESFGAKWFKAVHYLEMHLAKHGMGLNTSHVRDKLHTATPLDLLRMCEEAERYHGAGGARIGAQGLINFINKGRRTRHIPSIIGS